MEFKRVDRSGPAEGFGGGRAVLAVDLAKEDFVAVVLGPDAVVRVTFKWRHPGQTLEVSECLEGLAGAVALAVVLEPSGAYGDALVGQLRRLWMAVYRVSPKRAHDAAGVYEGVPSLHDAKAAELIRRLHLQGVSRVWEALGQERSELNAWLRRLEVSKGRLHVGLESGGTLEPALAGGARPLGAESLRKKPETPGRSPEGMQL